MKKCTKEVYFPLLESKIVSKNVRKKDISALLGISNESLSRKLNGRNQFKLDEAFKIQETYFPDISLNELFRHEC